MKKALGERATEDIEASILKTIKSKNIDNMVLALKQEHPILSKFQVQTIAFLLNQRKGVVMLAKGDVLFKSEDEDRAAYIICYGELMMWSSKKGRLGKNLTLADTVGESSVCEKEYVCRMYHCTCERAAGVIPIYLDWMADAVDGHPDEKVISNDIIKLELLLNKNHLKKRKVVMSG